MIRLLKTCGACPEQYEAYIGDEQIAYLRLRHGCFTVDVPDANGKQIYSACPKGDGLFEPDERDAYLSAACVAIMTHYCLHRSRLYVVE